MSAKATKQTDVAHYTPEAETVCANEAIRRVGIPALDIWEIALERTVPLQGVNIGWLHDLYKKELFNVMHSRTEAQCADVFTKSFKDLPKLEQAYRMIGMRKPGEQPRLPSNPWSSATETGNAKVRQGWRIVLQAWKRGKSACTPAAVFPRLKERD